MSAPPKFATLPDAIAAYREGRSRRWAEVDGHQVDLHAAAHPCAVSRPGADEPPAVAWDVWDAARWSLVERSTWDADVSRRVRSELSRPSRPCTECRDAGCRRSTHLTLTDRETGEEYRATKCEEAALRREVLPELAVPGEAASDASAYRCPWCSRPWDGAP